MLGTSKSIWGFDPRNVPGCQLWLDAADSSTITGTTSVTAWTDKSGNGRNTTTTGTVSYANSGVSITASNSYLTGSFGSPDYTGSTVTCFLIASIGSSSGNVARLFSLGKVGTQDWDNLASITLGRGGGLLVRPYRTVPTSSPPSIPAFDTRFLATWGQTSSLLFNSINGGALSTASLTGAFAINAYRIGNDLLSDDANEQTIGVINEIIVYFSELTTSQRQQVEGYLGHKWGLVAPSPTVPLSVPGCQLWLDGADPAGTGTPPADGATVSTWVDKSGNGYNATAAPSRTAGTYSTSFRAVNFPNSTTGYITNYSAAPTNETMFVVFNNPSPSGNNNIIIGGVSGARSLGAGYTAAGTGTVGNLNTQIVWLASTGTYTAGTTVFTTSQFTPSSNSVSLNGGTFSTGGAPGFTAGRVTYLGVDATNPVYYYIGYAMEIIFYNSVLTTTQRQTIETYLAKKWGIGASTIPSSHPFYSLRPHLRLFKPNDVTGCQLWLDAADSSTITFGTGSSVASWRDKANSYAVANSSAAYQPVYSEGTIRFNGVTSISYLDIPTLTIGSSTFSIFFVIRNTSTTTEPGNAWAPHFFWPLSGSGFLSINGWIDTNIQGINNNIRYTLLKNQYYVISYTFGVTSNFEQLYVNGTSVGTYQKSSAYASSLYRIGAINSTNTQASFDGNIGEILVYNTALANSERQQIEWYLANKWGIFSTSPVSTPLSVPGCGIWLDGADTSSMTFSGSTITQWRDKSSSSNHFGLSRGTATSILDGGRRVVNFADATVMVSTNQISFTGSSAFFIVSKMTSTNGAQNLIGFYPGITNGFSLRFFGNVLYSGNGDDLSLGNYYVNGVFNPSFPSTTYLNTYSLISTLVPSRGGTTIISLSDNWILDGFPQRFFIGNIAEFLFYPGGVTNIQRQKIEGYLANKWGLTLPAPTVHPYDKFPPASLHTVFVPTTVRLINLGTGSGGPTSGSFTLNSLVGGGTGTFTNSDVFMSDGTWGMAQCFDGARSGYDLYMTQNPNFMELVFPRGLMVTKIFLVPREQQDAFPSSLTLKANGTLVGTYTSTTVSQALGMGIGFTGTGFYIQPDRIGTTWRFDFTSTPVSFGEIEFWGYLPS